MLEGDEYRANAPGSQGVLRSPHFPRLAPAVEALLDQDAARVLDVLQTEMQTPAHAAYGVQLAEEARKGQGRKAY